MHKKGIALDRHGRTWRQSLTPVDFHVGRILSGETVIENECLEDVTKHFASQFVHFYSVYGIRLLSPIRLSLKESSDPGLFDIKLRMVPAVLLRDLLGDTPLKRPGRCAYQYAQCQDGSTYVRWDDIGEFLISGSGQFIACASVPTAHFESFEVYLLGQALSFALVKGGLEPVHASCVMINGEAVAFLGDSGMGKSSLAAYFLRLGHCLVTDDLLAVRIGDTSVLAYPGPPRIKLMPAMARRMLSEYASGVAMNPKTRKQIIALRQDHACLRPVPLRALYSLTDARSSVPTQSVQVRQLSPRDAFINLLSHTFNYVLVDGERLQRQFMDTVRLVHSVPVNELSYPIRPNCLAAVRNAILDDLMSGSRSRAL